MERKVSRNKLTDGAREISEKNCLLRRKKEGEEKKGERVQNSLRMILHFKGRRGCTKGRGASLGVDGCWKTIQSYFCPTTWEGRGVIRGLLGVSSLSVYRGGGGELPGRGDLTESNGESRG